MAECWWEFAYSFISTIAKSVVSSISLLESLNIVILENKMLVM